MRGAPRTDATIRSPAGRRLSCPPAPPPRRIRPPIRLECRRAYALQCRGPAVGFGGGSLRRLVGRAAAHRGAAVLPATRCGRALPLIQGRLFTLAPRRSLVALPYQCLLASLFGAAADADRISGCRRASRYRDDDIIELALVRIDTGCSICWRGGRCACPALIRIREDGGDASAKYVVMPSVSRQCRGARSVYLPRYFTLRRYGRNELSADADLMAPLLPGDAAFGQILLRGRRRIYQSR